MALTPQMIQAMNQATGNNVSPTGTPTVPSRAEQILKIANESKPSISTHPEYNQLSPGVKDVITDTAKDYKNAIPNFMAEAGRNDNSTNKNVVVRTGENALAATASGLNTVFAPITNAIKSTSNQISENKKVQDFSQNPTVSKILDFFQNKGDQLKAWEEAHPEAARNLSNAFIVGTSAVGEKPVTSVATKTVDATKGVISKGGDIAGQAITKVTDATGDIYKTITTKSPEQISAAINKNYNKGVRPSVSGKGTAGQVAKYEDKAKHAVQTIVENKPNLKLVDEFGEPTGKLPRNIKQFADAIEQTKKNIFDKYDALQKKAGTSGAKVELTPVSKELRIVQNDPTIQDLHPEIAKYAESRASALEKRGTYTTQQAQDAITNLNKSLDAFYKNPSYETASKASIDSMIANNMRTGLDSVIEKTSGAGYQDLKNQYGSLKTIEKDVVHRSIVDARKNAKGLLDFTDIASGAEVIKGLATFNPAHIASGLGARAIKEYMKYINNPNTAVKRLFNLAEKNGQFVSK